MAVAVSSAPATDAAAAAMALGDTALRDRLPQLWRSIEAAHYTYLEADDSPEKLQHRKKLEGYIKEYLSLVPHECKFGMSETGQVFSRTVNELEEFSAYKAGLGFAAIANYAANLIAQPWRKEYRTIRTYCGYYKHTVSANLVGAELMLQAMGYSSPAGARLTLEPPVSLDLAALVSRDALIAYVECQCMCEVWTRAWRLGSGVTWAEVARERARRAGDVSATVANLCRAHYTRRVTHNYTHGSEIYSNIEPSVGLQHADSHRSTDLEPRRPAPPRQLPFTPHHSGRDELSCPPVQPSYVSVAPSNLHHNIIYTAPHHDPRYPIEMNPMMNQYGVIPSYYIPVQAPVLIQTPMYASVKQPLAVNGYYDGSRYPSVPTAQLIELGPLESSDVPDGMVIHNHDRHRDKHKEEKYRDGSRSRDEKYDRREDKYEMEKRKSDKKSHKSDQISRSDTQPSLSAAQDGLGTYESWDYVFRNLSQREERDSRQRHASPPPDRDSRLEDKRRFQPTTMDLEDGMHAMNLDRSYDEEIYRTAKVNENLARLKLESEMKKAKAAAKKQLVEERERKPRNSTEILADVDNISRNSRNSTQPPEIHSLNPKVALDKVKLISRKDSKDRKDIIKQCSNGPRAESSTLKRSMKSTNCEIERPLTRTKPALENGIAAPGYSARVPAGLSNGDKSHMNAKLIVTLDESPSPGQSGAQWNCSTCTYVNPAAAGVCEMCGKSRRAGPETAPLTSGGRECPACTLVNNKDARVCDACGTSLHHSPTYI